MSKKLPNWNLNDFYTSIEDKQINIDLDSFKSFTLDFKSKYKDKLLLKFESFEKVILEYENGSELGEKLGNYAFLIYATNMNDQKIVLRVIGYPGNLRIDHPLPLNVESGRKKWKLDDITLLNSELAEDSRQAAAEFDLESLIQDISQNRPLRLSLEGVFSELPVPPFLVKEWRTLRTQS